MSDRHPKRSSARLRREAGCKSLGSKMVRPFEQSGNNAKLLNAGNDLRIEVLRLDLVADMQGLLGIALFNECGFMEAVCKNEKQGAEQREKGFLA